MGSGAEILHRPAGGFVERLGGVDWPVGVAEQLAGTVTGQVAPVVLPELTGPRLPVGVAWATALATP